MVATSFDQVTQLPGDLPATDRCIHNLTKTFTAVIIHNVKYPEATAISQLIMDKVHRPAFIGLGWYDHRDPGPMQLLTLLGPDLQPGFCI